MFSFLTRKKKPKRKAYTSDTAGDNTSIYHATAMEDMNTDKCEPSYDSTSSADSGSCGGD